MAFVDMEYFKKVKFKCIVGSANDFSRIRITDEFWMSTGSSTLQKNKLLIGKKITLKLWCLRILTIETLEYFILFLFLNEAVPS